MAVYFAGFLVANFSQSDLQHNISEEWDEPFVKYKVHEISGNFAPAD